MRLNKNYIQTYIFLLVYLFAIYYWTQPLQERKLPYGEYDAMSHFDVADHMVFTDKSFVKLPPYIDVRFYSTLNKFRPHTLWYPPTFHTSLAVVEAIAGERVVPVFLANTVMATFILITLYFVMRKLFGFLPAILSSFLLIFSPRDFLPYLWGQWPERFGYAFIPIVMYCFYKYFISYSKEDHKPLYLYLTAIFLGFQILIHALSFFHSIFALGFLYLFLAVKQKKIVLPWKQIIISGIIFLIILFIFPLQTVNFFITFNRGDSQDYNYEFSRFFEWSMDPNRFVGSVPPFYFSFKEMHGAWTLPFLFLGVLILALSRKERDLFLLAWLISLYFVLHRDIAGKLTFLHRSLSATAHIFIPITAIGMLYLPSLLKIPIKIRPYLKYFLAGLFLFFVFTVNITSAAKFLNADTYNPYSQSGFFTTLNQAELDVMQWLLENAPPTANVTIVGFPDSDQFVSATSRKIRWSEGLSQHVTRFYKFLEDKEAVLKNYYIVVDYTMFGALNDQQTLAEMQIFESETLINHTLLYNKDNIRVYKYES